MNIKPIGERIVVELKKEEVTISGIILSGDTSDQDNVASVVAIGDIKADVKIGDKVIIKRSCGQKFEDYIIVDMEDVLAVVE